MSTHQNLTHLKTGDKIAIQRIGFSSHVPRVGCWILTISKITPKQIVAGHPGKQQFRFLRETGKKVGEDYVYAVEATPEILAKHDQQLAELNRWTEAQRATFDLIDKDLHQLNLSTDQLERLAAAWAEIKAMAAKAP